MLWLYQRTMFGKLDNPANEKLPDMTLREVVTLAPLVILVFWIGIYPAPFFDALEEPVDKIVAAVRPGYFQAEQLDAAEEPAPSPEAVAEIPPADPSISDEETETLQDAAALGGAAN
jgi:NADH-quinone oxidoreductase subunit M